MVKLLWRRNHLICCWKHFGTFWTVCSRSWTELSNTTVSWGQRSIWVWFVLMFSSIWLFQKAGFCWHFLLSRHGGKKNPKNPKTWPINGATAAVQMWAGVVMAALLPPPAGGCRRKTVTGGCRGRERWCERTECRCRAQWSPQTAVTSCDTRQTTNVFEKSQICAENPTAALLFWSDLGDFLYIYWLKMRVH